MGLLEGRIAIVTGSGRGIGRAAVRSSFRHHLYRILFPGSAWR
jgi:NAD(P)-dependent dehydrogenase (short-subunit alcohol dehydrogenase family)